MLHTCIYHHLLQILFPQQVVFVVSVVGVVLFEELAPVCHVLVPHDRRKTSMKFLHIVELVDVIVVLYDFVEGDPES